MTAWYRKIDHVTLLTWLVLIGISLAAIYSTTHGPAAEFLATSVQQNFQSQFIWAIICTVGVAIALMLPVRFYQRAAYPAYVFCLGLLLLTLAIGKESGGATSWLMIGGMTLQTSELAKVGTVMAVAKLLSSQPSGEEGRGGNVRYAAGAVALLIVPAALILVQNDTGTALVFLGLIPIMLFWSGLPLATCALMISPGVAGYFAIRGTTVGWWLWVAVAFAVVFTAGIWWATRKRYMAILAALFTGGVILVATVALNEVLALHQTARIKSFTNPDAPEYRKGVGFHLVQSKAAIGSGGLWGKGYMEGTQTQGAYIPEQSTDFIFSVIGEEWGFAGGTALLLLFGVLIIRLVQLGARVKHPFGSMVAAGAAGIYLIHVFVNVGMATGLLPVIGIPLPFVSYGGSAMLANSTMLAIVLSLHMRRDDFSIYGY